jgi:hypothetical protein
MSYTPRQQYVTSSPSRSCLWAKPSVPNSIDDEFEGAALAAAWQLNANSFGAAAVDTYDAGFVAGQLRQDYNNSRRSWQLVQPPADGVSYYLTKDIGSFGALYPFVVWARMRVWGKSVGAINNDVRTGIVIGETSGGNFDAAGDYVVNYIGEADGGTTFPEALDFTGGTPAAFGTPGANIDRYGYPWEYVALHCVSNVNTSLWVAARDGVWFPISIAYNRNTSTFDRIGFVTTAAAGPPLVCGWDFIRVIEGVSVWPL